MSINLNELAPDNMLLNSSHRAQCGSRFPIKQHYRFREITGLSRNLLTERVANISLPKGKLFQEITEYYIFSLSYFFFIFVK